MSNVNVRVQFQKWMSHQKKSNGEPYKKNTVTAYVNALKNSSAKLNLPNIPTTDLFEITSLEEFTKIHNHIMAAPNFREVDLSAGNKAYSNGMILYARFLKEREEPSIWIFQGNPKYYDVVGAVDDLDQVTWAVNQYTKQIKEGDEAYIWLSGTGGGIIAAGRVLNNPETREALDDPYRRSNQLNNEPYLAVDIKIEKKLSEDVVERTLLLEDERTKNLEILTYPGATNFKVKKEENKVIKEIINGTYENIPVAVLSGDEKKEEKRFWIYAPGLDSEHWEEFYKNGIMGTRREEIGDLKLYTTKSAIKDKMKEIYGEEFTYRNAGHAAWQFANEMKVGDVIFVKKGLSKIIGRGIVSSDYFYDVSRKEYNHVRKVNWTHKGEWEHEGQAVAKMLTDITPYTEYYKKLERNFYDVLNDSDPSFEEEEIRYSDYTETDFLSEVYINKEKYHTLKNLLMRKKNLILLGAPGVGKTYAAERLAYSMMSKKDKSRLQVVQFHQSYSYEDFIMGYRPSENGFSIVKGPFYEFCKKAEPDDRPYFFIIDEINRGNLSKIFGELLMLIENDKRGKELRLLYEDEQFSVPENVFIIGMMNTADRSLAMIDYALRRRFAFFEFEPAFESLGFKEYQNEVGNKKFDSLIQTVIAMNIEIADDTALGSGFRIGHSYFSSLTEIDEHWLKEVVEYELIPLITEYWFDEPSQISLWSGKLRGAIQ
ncbi:AAA family ATPase [uncultured Planococcus sp.]|uniref:AAA family ATPase n=1 Tax=uncultured Planococcus sp. TaxID=337815 RepID=UPI0026132110|nr:AAA family ATPase [uncultured Planococcus sp.]